MTTGPGDGGGGTGPDFIRRCATALAYAAVAVAVETVRTWNRWFR